MTPQEAKTIKNIMTLNNVELLNDLMHRALSLLEKSKSALDYQSTEIFRAASLLHVGYGMDALYNPILQDMLHTQAKLIDMCNENQRIVNVIDARLMQLKGEQ